TPTPHGHDGHGTFADERDLHRLGPDAVARGATGGVGGGGTTLMMRASYRGGRPGVQTPVSPYLVGLIPPRHNLGDVLCTDARDALRVACGDVQRDGVGSEPIVGGSAWEPTPAGGAGSLLLLVRHARRLQPLRRRLDGGLSRERHIGRAIHC